MDIRRYPMDTNLVIRSNIIHESTEINEYRTEPWKPYQGENTLTIISMNVERKETYLEHTDCILYNSSTFNDSQREKSILPINHNVVSYPLRLRFSKVICNNSIHKSCIIIDHI